MPNSLTALKDAMIAMADDREEALQPELAHNLKIIAEDDSLLAKFASLLTQHDTPAAAITALGGQPNVKMAVLYQDENDNPACVIVTDHESGKMPFGFGPEDIGLDPACAIEYIVELSSDPMVVDHSLDDEIKRTFFDLYPANA